MNIVIKTKIGKLVRRKAELVDYIDSDGNQTTTAYVGKGPIKKAYRIAERKENVNIWISNDAIDWC